MSIAIGVIEPAETVWKARSARPAAPHEKQEAQEPRQRASQQGGPLRRAPSCSRNDLIGRTGEVTSR
jgi:hypothetical protein